MRKKSLVGWGWKDFDLYWLHYKSGGYAEIKNGVYKNKRGMNPQKGIIKVRITIEELGGSDGKRD